MWAKSNYYKVKIKSGRKEEKERKDASSEHEVSQNSLCYEMKDLNSYLAEGQEQTAQQ